MRRRDAMDGAGPPTDQRRGAGRLRAGAGAHAKDDRVRPARSGDFAAGPGRGRRRSERRDRQVQQGEQIATRDETVRSLGGRTVDLLVVGGGIIGAGIARDAALRGLEVALVEQADFGSGTTSRPTRLIHGGLRYLELFDFALVRSDMREREILLRIASHLVFPLPFLLPLYRPTFLYQLKLRLGMQLYDLLLRLTKGVHIVTRHAVEHAHVLFAKSDGRLFFVVPWLDATIVGTTDTDYTGDPGEVAATEEDVRYLQDEARRAFPSAPFDEIHFTWAGVRALVREEGVSEGEVSRKHALFDHAAREGVEGILSVVGGKITAYRAIAEEVVDMASRRLSRYAPSRSAEEALPGARPADLAARPGDLTLDAATRAHLTSLYGARAREVLDLAGADAPLAW